MSHDHTYSACVFGDVVYFIPVICVCVYVRTTHVRIHPRNSNNPAQSTSISFFYDSRRREGGFFIFFYFSPCYPPHAQSWRASLPVRMWLAHVSTCHIPHTPPSSSIPRNRNWVLRAMRCDAHFVRCGWRWKREKETDAVSNVDSGILQRDFPHVGRLGSACVYLLSNLLSLFPASDISWFSIHRRSLAIWPIGALFSPFTFSLCTMHPHEIRKQRMSDFWLIHRWIGPETS